jgi:hypothetical protein
MTMRKALQTGTKPDFRQLKKSLAYIERFAEGRHQANEERYLFRPVQAREPNLARTLAHLRRDHVAMKGYRIRLSEALSYWPKGDPKPVRRRRSLLRIIFGSASVMSAPSERCCPPRRSGQKSAVPSAPSPILWQFQGAAGSA